MSTQVFKTILIIALLASFTAIPAAHAQSSPDAWTTYTLNLRAGPATTYDVITTLPANTPLVVEGHNEDLTWLLVHTEDGTQRGWAAALYFTYQTGFFAARLPLSTEIVTAAVPVASTAAETGTITENSAEDIASYSAVLNSAPILPAISNHARAIYAGSGNDPHSMIKLGDCNSEYLEFMGPLASGAYNLGPYSYLQPAIDQFWSTMSSGNLTAHGGYTIYAVLDSTWTINQPTCLPNETPLTCELRNYHPAIAVMMFGPNDVFHLTAEEFESALRQVLNQTIANGTIPVLTTFTWCRTDEFQVKGLQFNAITLNVGQEYDIPVINFWRAAQDLPNCGLSDDTHLSAPTMTTSGDFTGEETRTGQTLRNLLTLQTLDALRITALQ